MTSTAIDLSAIRTDQTSYKGTFRALIGVYSTAEVDDLIAGVGGGSVVWGDIGGTLANQTDLQNALNAKASSSHTHSQSDITNLVSDLALKASIVYVDAGLATKAAASHTHAQSDITNLTTDLAAKQATLVSGTNIKTVNSTSLLGSGDVSVGTIGGSTGATDNRILRSDGTGGATAQASSVTIDDSGNATGLNSIAIASGTITASTPTSFSQTWNSSGVTFAGINWTVTDTASANGSKILQVQSGTAEIAIKKVASASNHTAAFRLVFGDSTSLAYSPEYGQLTVRNGTNTGDGGIVCWQVQALSNLSAASYVLAGGTHAEMASSVFRGSGRAFTTASGGGFHWSSTTSINGSVDVGFARNAAGVIEVNSGTTGTYRDIKARNITATALVFLGAYTVGTLPTASSNTGAMAYVTDSSVTTFNSTVSGGGSSVVKVFSNGTNWVVA